VSYEGTCIYPPRGYNKGVSKGGQGKMDKGGKMRRISDKGKREGNCPYTKSGIWPDKELTKIIEDTLSQPPTRCPKCGATGIIKGSGEVAWCECSQCGEKIGDTLIM